MKANQQMNNQKSWHIHVPTLFFFILIFWIMPTVNEWRDFTNIIWMLCNMWLPPASFFILWKNEVLWFIYFFYKTQHSERTHVMKPTLVSVVILTSNMRHVSEYTTRATIVWIVYVSMALIVLHHDSTFINMEKDLNCLYNVSHVLIFACYLFYD